MQQMVLRTRQDFNKERIFTMKLPDDPNMLYSILNMKLRDFYPSLSALCEDMEVDSKELEKRLREAGFLYDSGQNRIVSSY